MSKEKNIKILRKMDPPDPPKVKSKSRPRPVKLSWRRLYFKDSAFDSYFGRWSSQNYYDYSTARLVLDKKISELRSYNIKYKLKPGRAFARLEYEIIINGELIDNGTYDGR
jgi:hypothetical protein